MLSAAIERPLTITRLNRQVTPSRTLPRPPTAVLEEVLHRRRAGRQYSSKTPAKEILEAVAIVALQSCQAREAAGAARNILRMVLTVPLGSVELQSGVYDVDPTAPNVLSWRAPFDSAQSYECINQSELARATASMLAVGDLRTVLTQRGIRGYAETALAAGACVGMAWLAACSYGMVGTAAGGAIAQGFRESAAMDGFNECPLLAFHFGLPNPSS